MLLLLNQLNPIPKRIEYMTSANSRNAVVILYLDSRLANPRDKSVVIHAPQRWMRLPRRPKLRFHTKMKLHDSAFKPATSSLREFGRFRHLRHPKNASVKRPSPILRTRRHGELYMINSTEKTVIHGEHPRS